MQVLPKPKTVEGVQAPSTQFKDKKHYLPGKPTDDQIGDVLIEEWNGRYAHFYGQWHEYAGGVWLPAQTLKLQIWEMMKNLRKNYGCHDLRPSKARADGIEAYLQEYLRADEPQEQMSYINLQNGLYNLETHQLEPHRRELFMTSQLPFAFNPDAGYSDTWLKFLNGAFVNPTNGQPDRQMQNALQEAMGYTLTGNTDLRVSFWLVGESGTGKSVLISVLIALAGNAHAAVDLDALSTNPYQIADIAGKRLVTFTEPRANSVLHDGHYKRLVSQDRVMARQIFGKPFSFVPVCKVWGAMNETPRVIDRSDAVFNRVMIFPMNRVVPVEQRDGFLLNKLESELAGIFNWALVGLIRLRKTGKFTRSEQVEKAREDYKLENDNESLFVEECCERGLEFSISSSGLYGAYSNWCKDNGLTAKSSTRVARDWKRLGFQWQHTKRGSRWIGVRIKEVQL